MTLNDAEAAYIRRFCYEVWHRLEGPEVLEGYVADRDGNILRRLTKSKSADTSASFSADGRKIVFVSDRPGFPQIYMMDAEGGNMERLTEAGWFSTAASLPGLRQTRKRNRVRSRRTPHYVHHSSSSDLPDKAAERKRIHPQNH